jgi:Family of unknown function (DUF6338)
VLVPIALGILLGVSVQNRWLTQVLSQIKLYPLSPYRTGWDWVFGQRKAFFVIVTLEDGAQVAGWFGDQSLAASDLTQRDIYIEEVYDLDDQGNWHRRERPQGILITGKFVKHIEFLPPSGD